MHQLTPEIIQWLGEHGNIALFFLLAFGIIGLPIPEETLMIFAGYLIAKGEWSILPTILAAIGGSICGISISYGLGLSAGSYLIKKYGYLIGSSEQKIKYAQNFFDRAGKWSLFFGYFVLGIRHFTGYIAGSISLPFRKFALFAYSGAIIWGATFLSLGYFFHKKIEQIMQKIDFDIVFFILTAGILILYVLYRILMRRL